MAEVVLNQTMKSRLRKDAVEMTAERAVEISLQLGTKSGTQAYALHLIELLRDHFGYRREDDLAYAAGACMVLGLETRQDIAQVLEEISLSLITEQTTALLRRAKAHPQ